MITESWLPRMDSNHQPCDQWSETYNDVTYTTSELSQDLSDRRVACSRPGQAGRWSGEEEDDGNASVSPLAVLDTRVGVPTSRYTAEKVLVLGGIR